MSNYNNLKGSINNNIYENQTQQITGTVMNTILNEMTNVLGAGYQFAGVATVGMNPGGPDARVFYLAGEGIYTNFGNLQVPQGHLGILKWDSHWHLETIEGLGGGGANLTGYVSLASTDDLPDEGVATLGYLCGTNLYLYVGEGGDTKEGKYQNCGSFRGPQGIQGDTGVSVQSVVQTTTSTEDEGINIITCTLENGTQSTFQIKNGSKGSQGIQGPQGVQGEPGRLQAQYKQVETLPTASADTVDYIYLVESDTPNVYDMYYTEENQGAYSWQPLGTTAVQLSDYATKVEVSQLEAKVDELYKTTGSIKYGESGTNGGILKASDGTIVSNAYTTDFGVTDYTPVSGSVLIILNGGYQGAPGTYAVVSFYTDINEASFMSSKKYNSQGNVSNFRIDIPFGAKYFRASMADHNKPLSFIFGSLQEELNRARGESEIILVSGFRCIVSPSTIGSQIPDITAYSGYECAIISVSEGDVINLTATGTSAARTFAFADSNKIVTRVASYGTLTKVKITIPSGVAYMVINNTNIGAKSYYSPLLSLIGHEREITSIKSEQLEQDACLEGMVGKYTRAGFHPVPWGGVTKDKYWNLVDGSAGMVSASEYYARNTLFSATPGKKLKITVISGLYVSTDAAFSGYDNDGNPAYSGAARRNFSTADSYTVNADGTTTYVFTLGADVTQIGLFFKNVETFVEIEKAENRQYSPALDEHIQLVAGGGDTTSADSAKYYLKGASPKTFSKKVCILAAGQSNIDGRDDYADMPAEIKAAQPITNCHYVKNSESDPFAALNITGQWAFDLVTYYNIALARELYVIKWSVGGTSIDPEGDSSYHWTADYEELSSIGHSLLRKFENEIRNHIASDGNDFDVRAMLWHQGEGDRGSLGTGSADRYYDNLRNMISYVRGVVGNERLPIVTATISENSSQYDATIHAAQVRLASEDPYFVLIDMSGAPLEDSYHFNATASVYLGQMVYNALIDLGVITGTKLTPVRPW